MSQNASLLASSSSPAESADGFKAKVSVIEKSVTHLLVATKSLLETLTKWSKRQASETEVSDVYVRLGYEFNIACRAFKSVGVQTQDLGNVPDSLRAILEETLSGEPSQQYLDNYLPQIRDIIVNLLQGLKRKQQRLRASVQKTERDGSFTSATSAFPQTARQSTGASTVSSTGSDEADARQSSRYKEGGRQGSRSNAPNDSGIGPSRTSSGTSQHGAPQRTEGGRVIPKYTNNDERSRTLPQVTLVPATPAPADVPGPRPPPHPRDQQPPSPAQQDSLSKTERDVGSPSYQGKPGDALTRLQRGGELERRASRRFSAYQISKHLGSNSTGVPIMPPAQNSPIPNRGLDLRDTMNAVRNRGPQTDHRGTSRNKYNLDTTPVRQDARSVDNSSTPSSTAPTLEMPVEKSPEKSPLPKTPEDKLGYFATSVDRHGAASTTRTGSPLPRQTDQQAERPPRTGIDSPTPGLTSDPVSERSSQSQSKRLTVFLQYKTRIKKAVFADGLEDLSIPKLQLAFIEKFAWNTQSNGVELPEIYMQDPVSGVRHELEDLSDVKDRSVLVLNVDAVDEVKKHVDDGLGGLKALLQDTKKAVSDQASVLKRVIEQQQEATKEINKLATQPARLPPSTQGSQVRTLSNRGNPSSNAEVEGLRRELAVLRQSYTSMTISTDKSLAEIRAKADEVRASAKAPVDGTTSSSRTYITSKRKELMGISDQTMTRIEDLQDTIEDLRKDVVTRGVRPLPRQLETVSKEMSNATRELKKLQDLIKKEKPTLQKIWREELATVYQEQNELTYQEELSNDLEGDLQAASETFKLVEEATKQQNLANGDAKAPGTNSPASAATRVPSRTLNVSTSGDPRQAKDSVLGEVKALQPNHETRLEAIERAERNRRRELEERGEGEFKRELGSFVDEGKLKKSGGVEEAERVRKVKDERMRRLAWERANGMPASTAAATADQQAQQAQQQVSDSGDLQTASRVDSVAEAMQDLSTVNGNGLSLDTGDSAGPDKVTAAFAEAAKVPQPLSVDSPHVSKRDSAHPWQDAARKENTSPDPPFVEASEVPPGGFPE